MKTHIVAMMACSASCGPYYLETGGHVAIVRSDLTPPSGGTVYRDDLGDGLVSALAANPAAQATARVYRNRQRHGFIASMIGLGCGAVDLAFAGANNGPMGTPKSDLKVELGVGIGCMALSAVGLGLALSGNAYASDAIDLYNHYPVPAQLR
jgi:hypothetical protein